MKTIFFLLMTVLSAQGLYATHVCDKEFVIKCGTDGRRYAVSSIRSIKFNSGTLLLNLKDGSTEEWMFGNVGCIYFEETGHLEQTMVDGLDVQVFSLCGGMLMLANDTPAKVVLSSVDGKILVSAICKGALQLPLDNCRKGMYILNIDGKAYKIINR